MVAGGRRGIALLLVLGVLAVLSVTAITFQRIARIQRLGASNHLSARRARMAAEAGVEHALGLLRERVRSRFCESPWGAGFSGAFEKLPNGAEAGYRVSIIDAAARINLNDGLAPDGTTPEDARRRLVRMLTNLAWAIDEEAPPIGEREARALLAYRERLPGKRFVNLRQLEPVIGADAAEALRPFLTVHSWRNPRAVAPPSRDERHPDIDRFLKDPSRRWPVEERLVPMRPRVSPRSPIDVNTAPYPVLVAVLAGLRAVYVDRNPRRTGDEAAFGLLRKVEISREKARRVAAEIVKRRAEKPFCSWADFRGFLKTERPEPEAWYSQAKYITISISSGADAAYFRVFDAQQFTYDETFDPRKPHYHFNPEAKVIRTWQVPTAWERGKYRVKATRSEAWITVSGSELQALRWRVPFHIRTGGGPRGRFDRWNAHAATVIFETDKGEYTFEIAKGFAYWKADGYLSYVGSDRRLKRARIVEERESKPDGWWRYATHFRRTHYVTGGICPGSDVAGEVVARRFRPNQVRSSPVSLTDAEAALILANANPNAHPMAFAQPGALREPVDKLDLVDWTTELCFHSGGLYEIEAKGWVTSADGQVLSRYQIETSVALFDLWQETSLTDFADGKIEAPATDGAALAFGPQPVLQGLDLARGRDGHLSLGPAVRPDPGGRLLRLLFGTDGLGAELDRRRTAATVGDLTRESSRAPGTLMSDGAYSGAAGRRTVAPAYPAFGNIGGFTGAISFWFRPDWGTEGKKTGRYFLLDASHGGRQFWIQYVAPGWEGRFDSERTAGKRGAVRFRYDLAPGGPARTVSAAFDPADSSWLHVVAVYDLRAEEPSKGIRLYLNGVRHDGEKGGRKGRGASLEDGRTVWLGGLHAGRRERFGANGLYRSFQTSTRILTDADVKRLYTAGPLRSDAEIIYASSAWSGSAEGELRVGRVHWTGYLPDAENLEGGKIELRVETTASDPRATWVDTPDSPVDRPITGALRYKVRLRHAHRKAELRPILATPVIDDVTLTILRPPTFRWRREGLAAAPGAAAAGPGAAPAPGAPGPGAGEPDPGGPDPGGGAAGPGAGNPGGGEAGGESGVPDRPGRARRTSRPWEGASGRGTPDWLQAELRREARARADGGRGPRRRRATSRSRRPARAIGALLRTLQVVVLDARSGKPIPGAAVKIRPDDGELPSAHRARLATTDAQGLARFPLVQIGLWQVLVRKPGLRAVGGSEEDRRELVIRPEDPGKRLVVKLVAADGKKK